MHSWILRPLCNGWYTSGSASELRVFEKQMYPALHLNLALFCFLVSRFFSKSGVGIFGLSGRAGGEISVLTSTQYLGLPLSTFLSTDS